MHTTRAALLTLVAIPASAQPIADRIEISEDGRIRAAVIPQDKGLLAQARGPAAPFPAQPDWQNSLRRQVGALEIADLNNDGLNDLAVGCYISNSFPPYDNWQNMIYYNTGSGLEDDPSWISDDQVSTTDVKVADFNLDGFPDLLSVNGGFALSDSTIYFGSPTGPSTTAGWTSNEPINCFSTYGLPVDLDEDGDMDLVIANQGIDPNPFRPIYFFENDNGTLGEFPAWQSAASDIQNSLAVGDYDGDGDLDLAVSKWANFETAIYETTGGQLENIPSWTTGLDGTDKGIAMGDTDGDGTPELALGADDATTFYTLASPGNYQQTWESTESFFGVQDLRYADADDDGDLDLAEVHFSNGVANIYLNEDGVFPTLASWKYDAPSVGTAIAFGDLNNDGATDLAIGYSGDVSIRVFYGTPRGPCLADVNQNGQLEPTDFGAWLAAYNAGERRADQNQNGAVEPTDFGAWLANYNAGC